MTKKEKHETQVRHLTTVFAFLFVTWGFYRLLFQVPDPYDEVLVKPLIWLTPVFLVLKKEKSKLESFGITSKNLFQGIYFGLILGIFFAAEAFFVNFIKYKGVNWGANIGTKDLYLAIGISFITAISEEVVFRGYFFNKLWELTKNEWSANLISTGAWTLLYLPLAVFDWKLQAGPLAIYMFLVFVFGFGSALLFGRTKNIVSSIILHVLWAWPIILFR